jgi:hypothetical protein
MRKRFALLIAALCSLTILVGGLGAQAYDLRCRGGEVNMFVNGSELIVHIFLKRAASHTSVRLGECAWMDRVLNQYEEPHVVLKTSHNKLQGLNYNAAAGTMKFGFTDPDPRMVTIFTAMKNGSEYIIKVKNDGGGTLYVQ